MPSRILLAQRVSKDNGGSAVRQEWNPLRLNKQIYNGTSSVYFNDKTGLFELKSGTYYIKCSSIFRHVGSCKIAVMTSSKPPNPIILGIPSYAWGSNEGPNAISLLEGVWTIEHAYSSYVYYWVESPSSTSDLGMKGNDGLDNVYTSLLIQEL